MPSSYCQMARPVVAVFHRLGMLDLPEVADRFRNAGLLLEER